MTMYHLTKRSAFYRSLAQGYTNDIAQAGTFSEIEAKAHVTTSAPGEVTMTPVPAKVVTDHEVEAMRAGIWAAHTSLALDDLKQRVRAFARGVSDKVPQHAEPRVVGFKAEWSELLAEASKPAPPLPTNEEIRKMLENQISP